MSEQTCEGRKASKGRLGSRWAPPCNRRATVERDGHHYCGTHDPVACKERREKRDADWRARYNSKMAAMRAEDERERFDSAIGDLARAAGITAEDLAAGRVRVVKEETK